MTRTGPQKLSFKEYKSVLLDYDFKYFFSLEAKENGYAEKELQTVYFEHQLTLKKLQKEASKNRKQYRLYLEGQVHLMFMGGLLTSLFRIDGWTVEVNTFDFKSIGENWAYFELWQKLERKNQRRKKTWDVIVKIGAALAYILSLIKLIEVIIKT